MQIPTRNLGDGLRAGTGSGWANGRRDESSSFSQFRRGSHAYVVVFILVFTPNSWKGVLQLTRRINEVMAETHASGHAGSQSPMIGVETSDVAPTSNSRLLKSKVNKFVTTQ